MPTRLLDILLQRNDTEVPWGFQVEGGLDRGKQPVISSVTFGTLAAQHLNAGDKILQIQGQNAETIPQAEIRRILDRNQTELQLLVEKIPSASNNLRGQLVERLPSVPPNFRGQQMTKPRRKSEPLEVFSEQEWVKEREGNRQSTKVWLRETNRNPTLGGYDLEVNFERTKYREPRGREKEGGRNQKRMQLMSDNFEKIFREKIGEWLEMNMLGINGTLGKQQSNTMGPAGDGSQGVQPAPPPPPSFPGSIAGRRLKTEMPERSLEPPSVIQNAMMTKDKKPFTYTPGGIDLSEIRSPKMQRRINRNACADEMPGMPAPTTNQSAPVPPPPPTNTHFAAMQSQLPAQVLPQGAAPPPPPPPPPSGSEARPAPPPAPPVPSSAPPKPMAGRPPLGFDPNELLARVNKSPAYEPSPGFREEPPRNFRPQPVEEKKTFEPKQQNEIGQNIHVPLQNVPGHIYVPQVTPKVEPTPNYTQPTSTTNTRGQLGSLYVPPVAAVNQEQSTPSPTSPYGYKIQQQPQQQQQQSPASPAVDTKPQAPWVTVYRTPQSSVPWANKEPESPKPAAGTRIIPIQIEGRDSPKPSTPSPQPQATPPPFLQSPQMRQQQQQQQQQQTMRQQPVQQQQQTMGQQSFAQQQQAGSARVIPIQIEGSSQSVASQQPRSPAQGFTQNKFNPMTPMSPTPFSPSQDKEQKPQWAPVQPRPFKKEPEGAASQQRGQEPVRNQQPQPEYGTYNTAGVPLSQLRKMQLSDDDRALMDKFKSQVESHGNDILSDENCNPRYRGGYIPSRVFKMLDESVDDETYLHRESDPRYRGAVIPSRAFRMLQSMTDTAGDMQQQVPRSPSRGPSSRPVSGTQFQQDTPQGPYVPPSEQQVQEPRKYTGGSIPSRSFRMLQAMTGQEVTAPSPSGSVSGHETPVSGINRWCPSPSPSPIDPFWGYYPPPDPYFIYNYISDLNAAYGFPPPPPPTAFPQPPPSPFRPSLYNQMYQSYSSDTDEQGYSSTDELAQYYANYRKNFGYSPFQTNSKCSTPNSFKVPRVCVTPVPGMTKIDQFKLNKINKAKEEQTKQTQTENKIFETKTEEDKIKNEESNDDEQTSTEEESESDTEVEEVEEVVCTSSTQRVSSLQTLKSVSNVNVYSSESTSTIVQEEIEVEEEEEEEEEEVSETSEEIEVEEQVPHQLSIIFEESEHSDVESIKRLEQNRNCPSVISESEESCSTLDNGEDESDNDILDAESSVIVRLPLKLKFSRTEDDEDVTTVIVGDSEMERDTMYNLNPVGKTEQNEEVEEEVEEEESTESDDADVSVTFTVPSRSNSVISVDADEQKQANSLQLEKTEKEDVQVETEVTVCLSLARTSEPREEAKSVSDVKAETCESPHLEEDSSSTSVQSGDTILKHKEDTDEENSEGEIEDKPKTFKSWMEEENNKDWIENEKTVETEEDDKEEEEEEEEEEGNSYKAGVGKLEEMISSLLETTRDTMSSSVELSPKNLMGLQKKDSQEESEEDDSGVTSDISMKQLNSETDADTESDYSELSKMTKYQRASTHSRLFKLLQDECGREDEEEGEVPEEKAKPVEEISDTIISRKQKLTLPLNQTVLSEVESLSSSSGIASPCSPTISDRLVKELIHSLLNKKKGKKFRKLPLAKLHAAALRILQEEMDPYDTSPSDDGLFLSPIQKKKLHSKLTAAADSDNGIETQYLEPGPEGIYGENYYDYLDYYNTWGNPELYYPPEDYDIVPSRAFKMLREQTSSPKPIEGFKARCPRVVSKKNIPEAIASKSPGFTCCPPNDEPGLSFAEKQEKVSKVLEKSVKG